MFSYGSPHAGDSNEYTQYTIFNIKKITPDYPKSAAMGYFSKALKNEFETAVVNEPLVSEPLKVYCISPKNLCCYNIYTYPYVETSSGLAGMSHLSFFESV